MPEGRDLPVCHPLFAGRPGGRGSLAFQSGCRVSFADPGMTAEETQMDIEAVLRKHEDALLAYPNVNAVGIGERAGRPVIKVMVTRKVPEASLKPGQILPRDLEGFAVDVEESGEITAQ